MNIHHESIKHLTNWMRTSRYFSFAGFSDAEWYCIMGMREGEKTALGQVISKAHGARLLDVIKRRQSDPRFVFAMPSCLWPSRNGDGLPGFAEGQIDWFLGKEGVRLLDAFERDKITDDLARDAGLCPLINELHAMNVGMIGPAHLRGTQSYLRWKAFVEVSTPNLHHEPGGIERAVEQAAALSGKNWIWCVSAGLSAAVIIDKLHDRLTDCWLMDCGSIWDAFVKAGGQRTWRAELYADPAKWEQWIKDNMEGKDGRGW